MNIIKFNSTLLHLMVGFLSNFYTAALGVVSECCDSMNIEYSFLWGCFVTIGSFLVCTFVVLICCYLRKSGGQGDNFEQNRVLEH